MAKTHQYAGTASGHDIELEFDKSRVVVNKAMLRVDGEVVDSARIVYGGQELRTTLDDGTDGSWQDLSER